MPAPSPPVRILPFDADLPAACAGLILEQWGDALPDLSTLDIVLAQRSAAGDLRRALAGAAAAAGHAALLGPRIRTLPDYLHDRPPGDTQPLSRETGLLLLVEALRGHEALFGEADTWRLAEHLLALFQQLTLQQAALPVDPAAFRDALCRAYRIETAIPRALEREAAMIHQLWLGWRRQLRDAGRPDDAHHHLDRLAQAGRPGADELGLVLVGWFDLSTAEFDWLRGRLAAGNAWWLLHGEAPDAARRTSRCLAPLAELPHACDASEDSFDRCLSGIFDPATELLTRSREMRTACPDSPLAGRLALASLTSAEHEARAIDLRIREWLLEGREALAIVTEDRRLARRVRALLERAGIGLDDTAGWALSTSRAAATLERWLECIEQGFDHQPLLDFLKSPFTRGPDPDTHLRAIHRFEQDIVLQGGIARDLNRYRRQLRVREHLLHHWPAPVYAGVRDLLDRLDTAARPLQRLLTGRHPAAAFLAALDDSLRHLDLQAAFEQDPAGERLLQVRERLAGACRDADLHLSWNEFRTWFGRSLETAHFTPPAATGPVRLLSLEQSQCLRFDGLIIAGCDREHLPGGPTAEPFFNDRVRADLGLVAWRDRLDVRLYHFRRLLSAADRLLLTRHCDERGDPVLASPWFELLQSFHRLAYDDDLEDRALLTRLAHPGSQVRHPDRIAPPAPPVMPRPILPAALRPKRFSATSYQRLVDCPYAFFAAEGLGLKPPEAIREALQKQDYGERVHQCLEAFHGGVRGLPGPFDGPLEADNREAAIRMLGEIAAAVFARDLEDNFQHRGWLKRWLARIPEYIDWQIGHAGQWRVSRVEQRLERRLRPDLELRGRLDRIDTGETGLEILDYKTGHTPTQDEVETGEAVQLPFYRLLLEDETVAESAYLKVDDKVKTTATLTGEELEQLSRGIRERLETAVDAIDAGAPLPAWGDESSCRYCDMDGLCRRAVWGRETVSDDQVSPQEV